MRRVTRVDIEVRKYPDAFVNVPNQARPLRCPLLTFQIRADCAWSCEQQDCTRKQDLQALHSSDLSNELGYSTRLDA